MTLNYTMTAPVSPEAVDEVRNIAADAYQAGYQAGLDAYSAKLNDEILPTLAAFTEGEIAKAKAEVMTDNGDLEGARLIASSISVGFAMAASELTAPKTKTVTRDDRGNITGIVG